MKQEPRRVVVTGIGVVAPNGHGKEDYSKALRHGVSGLRYIPQLEELKFSCRVGGIPQNVIEKAEQYFPSDEIPAMNENMIYAGIAALDAFTDAGLKVPEREEDYVYEDTGAIVGTGIGGIDTFAHEVYPLMEQKKVRRLGSTIVERVMMSASSAKIGGLLGLGNQVTSNSSACSTGTEAVIMGTERIRAGLADRMVVGGSEGSDPFVWCGFDSMRVLCKAFNDDPESASRPMSASAAGFIPGSGAGILVLEELEVAKARGARIYAEVAGAALNSGGMRFGGSMTAPSASGVRRCIRTAILDAGVSPLDIDYINGHLTATMADPLEVGNWSAALERGTENFPAINSTKSLIGHALGASGALETVATIIQMTDGFIAGSKNCEDLHEKIAPFEKSVVRETRDANIRIAAKASFGFGDVNSCIILRSLES